MRMPEAQRLIAFYSLKSMGFTRGISNRLPSSGLTRLVMSLLLIVTLLPLDAASQKTPAPAQQAADQDCEKIKQDIQQLQQDLANVSAEMQNLTNALNSVNADISRIQADLKTETAAASSIGGKLSGTDFEVFRGRILDSLAKALAVRKSLQQQLEDDATIMQDIKNEIADLLNKLANCGPPSTTEPPKPEPPKKENKEVGMGQPPQPGPPKPLVSMQVGGGVGFNNIGGTSGDRAAFLNSFPGATFSTSANTFAGNVGSSLGIGPMIFDFNAWRANGSDSKGSGPVLGGGTDTAHITQQDQGISLTGGGKIPLGGGVSLILRGGGNFWHDNIDTKETVVSGSSSNTSSNSRSVDGSGWTTGAALQVDISQRWSMVFRYDYLPMSNAGVNVHLSQGSVGVMFRLFGVPK